MATRLQGIHHHGNMSSSRGYTQLIYLGTTFAGLLYTRGIGECCPLRQGKHLCYQDFERISACG